METKMQVLSKNTTNFKYDTTNNRFYHRQISKKENTK